MLYDRKCLVIGYGSIGKRHVASLSRIIKKKCIYVLSQKKINNYKTFNNIKDIINIDFDYIVIASPTSVHYKQIKFIEKNFKNKIILVEKPLFHKDKAIDIKRNKFFVGYNLRFHPVIKILRKKMNKKKIFSVNLKCSSFLPAWRKFINYKKNYSAKKKMGGGVILDLSHELDYFQFIFGKINIKNVNFVKKSKISNLKIDVEDNVIIQGKQKNIDYFFNINFFSKYNCREIIVETFNQTIKADLLKNLIQIYNKSNNLVKKIKVKQVDTYFEQHLNLLKKKFNIVCSLNEGFKLMKLIDQIKKFKNK